MTHRLLMINGSVMGNYCLTLRCQTWRAGKYTRFVSFGEPFLLKAPHRSRGFPATSLDAWKRTHQSAALTNIWLVVNLATPLKIMEFVSWDDEIPENEQKWWILILPLHATSCHFKWRMPLRVAYATSSGVCHFEACPTSSDVLTV